MIEFIELHKYSTILLEIMFFEEHSLARQLPQIYKKGLMH